MCHNNPPLSTHIHTHCLTEHGNGETFIAVIPFRYYMKTLSLRSLLPELHSRTSQNRWNGSERTVLRPNTRAITVTFAGGQTDETEEEVRIGEDTTRRLSLALGCLYLLSSDLISIRILINLLLHPPRAPQRGKVSSNVCH